MTDATVANPPFRIGGVFSRGIDVFSKNIGGFTALAILFTVPVMILGVVIGLMFASTVLAGAGLVVFVVGLVFISLISSYLAAAAITYGTFETLRGEPAGFRACFGRGLALIGPAIGVAVVYSLIVVVGLAFLIVPGLILMTVYWVALPVAVVERPGVFASLSRSAELTKGNRWRIFSIMAIVFVVSFAVNAIITLIFGDDAPTALDLIVSAWIIAIWGVIGAVTYHDLRVAKEGVEADQIAAVFD